MKKMFMFAIIAMGISIGANAQEKKCKETITEVVTKTVREVDCCKAAPKPKPRQKPKPKPVVKPQPLVVEVHIVKDKEPEVLKISEHKRCHITQFSAWPIEPKYGERVKFSWSTTGDCEDRFDIDGGHVTFDDLTMHSAVSEQLYTPQRFTLVARDYGDGTWVRQDLMVVPLQDLGLSNNQDLPSVVPTYGRRHRTVGHYLLCVGVPIVGGALLAYGGVKVLGAHHSSSSASSSSGIGQGFDPAIIH
jgi:hypothetical protein